MTCFMLLPAIGSPGNRRYRRKWRSFDFDTFIEQIIYVMVVPLRRSPGTGASPFKQSSLLMLRKFYLLFLPVSCFQINFRSVIKNSAMKKVF